MITYLTATPNSLLYTLITDVKELEKLGSNQEPIESDGKYLVTDYDQEFKGEHLTESQALDWINKRTKTLTKPA